MKKYNASKGTDMVIILVFAIMMIGGCLFLRSENPEVFSPWINVAIVCIAFAAGRICYMIHKRDDDELLEEIRKDIESDHRVEEFSDDEYLND